VYSSAISRMARPLMEERITSHSPPKPRSASHLGGHGPGEKSVRVSIHKVCFFPINLISLYAAFIPLSGLLLGLSRRFPLCQGCRLMNGAKTHVRTLGGTGVERALALAGPQRWDRGKARYKQSKQGHGGDLMHECRTPWRAGSLMLPVPRWRNKRLGVPCARAHCGWPLRCIFSSA